MIKPKLLKRILSGVIISALSFYVVFTGGWLFLLYVAFAAAGALYEWMGLALKTPQAGRTLFIGIVYIAISFGMCVLLRFDYPVQYLLAFFFMVAFSDMGAYLFGKVIGGPKMASAVSPNKTWAGLVGACVMPALIGFVFGAFIGTGDSVMPFVFAVLGGVLGLTGQAGDLLISSLKRQAGAKDAGGIIPGHGGVLDRLDAMMLAMPVYYLFLIVYV